jgi:hypothetical protein
MTEDFAVAEEIDHMGPIDYIVVEFPGEKSFGEGLPLLADLVDNGTVRILDLLFLRKDAAGVVIAVSPEQLADAGMPELAVFEGAASGLIDDDDLLAVADVLGADTTAAVLVYENAWAAPLARAVRRGGGQLVADGRIPVQAILAALDATDPAA